MSTDLLLTLDASGARVLRASSRAEALASVRWFGVDAVVCALSACECASIAPALKVPRRARPLLVALPLGESSTWPLGFDLMVSDHQGRPAEKIARLLGLALHHATIWNGVWSFGSAGDAE